MNRSGQTTRLIDQAVQSLFDKSELFLLRKSILQRSGSIVKNGLPVFIDPDHKMSNRAQQDFIYRVMRRLESEHSGSIEFAKTSKDYIHIKTK